MPTITLEEHGPLIVRILGGTLHRAAAQPKLARRMDKLKGRVALRSSTDPQSATIHFDRGNVSIAHGVHPAADVVITADLNTMGQPNAPKPKVKGALAHLGLALGAAKVLDPPTPGGWRGAVDEFWAWAAGKPGKPDELRVVCTDDDTDHVVGTAGGSSVEIHGPAWALVNVFTGGDHLGAALLENRVQMVGDIPTVSPFIGLVTKRLLGEQ